MNDAMHKNTHEFTVADHECPRPDGSTMLIRVARPQGDGPFPGIIDIHGGGWHMGDRNANAAIDDTLAANGIVAVAPEFRQAPATKYPVSIADAHLAVRWLKTNASKLGVKPEWIGGIGTSSGGHQLLTMMLQPDDPRYAALALPGAPTDATLAYAIAGWPVADPLARFRMAQKVGNKGLLDAHAKYWSSEEEMADGNPQQLLARGKFGKLPPLLVLQGTNDDNLPPDMASNFVTAYRKAGGTATLNVFEGQIHAFVVRDPKSDASTQALRNMVDFIKAQAR
jgi:acetyl esterase/lipase